MKKLSIGDVTITSIIERDGPWRTPQEMLPAYDPMIGKHHLAELDPAVFDPGSGKMVIKWQACSAHASEIRQYDEVRRRSFRSRLTEGRTPLRTLRARGWLASLN